MKERFLSDDHLNLVMSAQSVPLGLPDPFYQTPSFIAAPISGISHVPFTQVLNSGSAEQLYSTQCLSPFIINFSASTGIFTLPDAFTLSQAYGNSLIPTSIASQVPGFSVLPSNQVQPGDVFSIPLYLLSTSTAGFTWLPGTGGAGSHTTTAYATARPTDELVIQFTAVGPSLSQCAYTLQ